MTKSGLLTATVALIAFGATAAAAQPIPPPPGPDPYGYYSQMDHNGYYDRNGVYRHIPMPEQAAPPPPPPPPGGYYRQGEYEQNCHRGNATAGTIFGALAGGLLGSAASHGNGGAVVGGAILGGLFGNAVGHDIDCDDQPFAFRVYADGLNGDIGRRYDWRHGDERGFFTPTREYRRGGLICRDFTETTYHGDRAFTRTGSACRERDGNWRFN